MELSRWPAPHADRPVDAVVALPGSKSLTNRELVLAAIADGPGTLHAPLHSDDSARMIDSLRALGVGLSIDDYGTGYSSLSYLQDLPVDELKLDRTFVARCTADPRSAAIVRSTVDLAHSLGLRLVAEGVEDTATLERLRAYGCDVSQGFLHSRPLPADELGRWLAAYVG